MRILNVPFQVCNIRSIYYNLLLLMEQKISVIRKLFAITFDSRYHVTVKGCRTNSTVIRDIYDNLTSHSSSDQWRVSFISHGEISMLGEFLYAF